MLSGPGLFPVPSTGTGWHTPALSESDPSYLTRKETVQFPGRLGPKRLGLEPPPAVSAEVPVDLVVIGIQRLEIQLVAK